MNRVGSGRWKTHNWRNHNGEHWRISLSIYRKVVNLTENQRVRNVAGADSYPKRSCVWRVRDGSLPCPSHILPLPFPTGPGHPGSVSFPRLAPGTCSLELPGPGYSQVPPSSDRPSELPDLHGQTVWAPPALAVQLGCWDQRHPPDMQPGERGGGEGEE